MNIEILSMRNFEQNSNAIDIALPVLAIECEATPPLENDLDAYEEATLRLVALGLNGRSIANSLFATESLIDEVLSRLEEKKYIKRKKAQPWTLTDDGRSFLDGTIKERESSESQYGFMFVNALKKEILPYFHLGDIGRIPLFRKSELPERLSIEGDDVKTFAAVKINRSKLKGAYKAYNYNVKNCKRHEVGEITREEAVDLFADLESFDEEVDESVESMHETRPKQQVMTGNRFIRALDRKYISLYLHMRVIIDPTYPGGYRAESPFDFGGIDNDYFLKQIQWVEQSENTYIGNELFRKFISREICKLSPYYDSSVKDFHVFILEKMPNLELGKARFSSIYENMERIYVLMQQKPLGLIEKENIVSCVSRYVLEALQNRFFQAIDRSTLNRIKTAAFDEMNYYGVDCFKRRLASYCKLDQSVISWMQKNTLTNNINRLTNTFGNSTVEKYINMLLIEYYIGDVRIHCYISEIDPTETYRKLNYLNRIRCKVAHDTGTLFTVEDYNYYIENVFSVVNDLLNALMEV